MIQIIILSCVLGIYGFVLILLYVPARNIPCGSEMNSFIKPFFQMVLRVKKNRKAIGKSPGVKQKDQWLRRQFVILDPSRSDEVQLMEFQAERIGWMLFCTLVGLLFGLVLCVSEYQSRLLMEDGILNRPAFGSGSKIVSLTATEKEQIEDLRFEIKERKFTKAETDQMYEELDALMTDFIIGSNEALDQIRYPMNLVRRIENYPFDITWESSAYELIDLDGNVQNKELTEPVLVTLTATLTYEEWKYYLDRNIVICPEELTEQEKIHKKIVDALDEKDQDSSYVESLQLPVSDKEGVSIVWKEKTSGNIWWVLLFTAVSLIVIYVTKYQDVQKKVKVRERELLADYSELIGKFTLYLGAGMTIRNTFFRMASDYTKRRGKRKQYLYEEILFTCRELQLGISEPEAYEHFGKRCRIKQYVRLAALLNQNLKKGSNNLNEILHDEAKEAFETRKNNARRLGEEAGTKLLAPMMLMLCVVMVIIMIPAFLSFGM